MEDKYTELYEKFSKLQWLLRRHHMMNHAGHGPFADTTRGQGRVLAMLKIQPEISTKDLSYILGIKVASLNELLNKLEKGGYIVRKPSETDKRIMIIHLTEKGKSAQQADTDYSSIFNCLSATEQDEFGGYLDRVITALEKQLGAEVNEEEMFNWANAARSRMGDEKFEQMMSMRGCFGHHGHNRPDSAFFGKFGHNRRGPVPENMPGSERFHPNCNGPVPDGRGFGPFGGRPGCKKNLPANTTSPHEPDDM